MPGTGALLVKDKLLILFDILKTSAGRILLLAGVYDFPIQRARAHALTGFAGKSQVASISEKLAS